MIVLYANQKFIPLDVVIKLYCEYILDVKLFLSDI